MKSLSIRRLIWISLLALAWMQFPIQSARAQTSKTGHGDKSYVIEYYYKAKWGYADEFIKLFTKNHYPVLKKEIELGRLLRVDVAKPRYHTTEDGRWDYRVTITWKDAQTANDDFDAETITNILYPDQDTFKREEQRRFDILLSHWDLPVTEVSLEKK